jgi:hypothetical protein
MSRALWTAERVGFPGRLRSPTGGPGTGGRGWSAPGRPGGPDPNPRWADPNPGRSGVCAA